MPLKATGTKPKKLSIKVVTSPKQNAAKLMSTTGQIPSKQVKHQKTKSHLPPTINSYLTAKSKDEVKLKEVKEVKDDDSGGH